MGLFNPDAHKGSRQNIAMNSMKLFATTVAVIAAFVAWAPAYDWSAPYVYDFIVRHYGYSFADLIMFAWGIALALIIYAISQAFIVTGIMILTVTAVTRFV